MELGTIEREIRIDEAQLAWAVAQLAETGTGAPDPDDVKVDTWN